MLLVGLFSVARGGSTESSTLVFRSQYLAFAHMHERLKLYENAPDCTILKGNSPTIFFGRSPYHTEKRDITLYHTLIPHPIN